jgi:hypothetical protein
MKARNWDEKGSGLPIHQGITERVCFNPQLLVGSDGERLSQGEEPSSPAGAQVEGMPQAAFGDDFALVSAGVGRRLLPEL